MSKTRSKPAAILREIVRFVVVAAGAAV